MKNDEIEAINTKPHTISVGTFSTRPVSMNETNTGMKNASAIIASIAEIIPKKPNGL